jgi:DNA-binding CsgD family transcriptional regulator
MCARRDPEAAIGRIYEASTDSSRWSDALDAMAVVLDSRAMLLVYGDLPGGRPEILDAVGFRRSSISGAGSERFIGDHLIRESMNGAPGVVLSSGRSFRGKKFRQSDTYRYLLAPNGLAHIGGAAVLNSPEVYASLWMARADGAPDFSIHDLHVFMELLPHVARAMTVHHRIRRAEFQAEMAVGAFDRFAVGIVLLDVRGVPVMVNREATRIGNELDGFVIREDGVAAAESNETEVLHELVRRVGWVGPTGERAGGGAVRLSRPSGRNDYHVVVLPLPRRCQPVGVEGAVEVLFITDTEKSVGPIDYLFGDLYGLTGAEVRLVTELLEGCGLTAAAEKFGLSRNTVHSQLSSIFQKTGTKRQGELLRLLLSGIAPVEAPDETSGFDIPRVKVPTIQN